jgi:hypothetical protein
MGRAARPYTALPSRHFGVPICACELLQLLMETGRYWPEIWFAVSECLAMLVDNITANQLRFHQLL